MRSPSIRCRPIEALAQLAGLGVAHPDAIAYRERGGRGAKQRGLHLPRPLLAVEA